MIRVVIGAAFAFLIIGYISIYGYSKHACLNPKFVAVDPWVGAYPSNLVKYRGVHWGFDWDDEGSDNYYRDPEFEIGPVAKTIFNAVYLPVRFIDQRITGWSVKFRGKPETFTVGSNGSALLKEFGKW